jgi:hypothetical protein
VTLRRQTAVGTYIVVALPVTKFAHAKKAVKSVIQITMSSVVEDFPAMALAIVASR